MDVDQGAEIGHEFHRTRQAVVESGAWRWTNLDPFGPERQGRAAGSAIAAGKRQSAVGAEPPRRLDRAVEEGAAADEARPEALRRPFVEVALTSDLAYQALVHDHQPGGHGERLLLALRHHDPGEAHLP